MSFKLVPFESLGTVSYSPSVVTMAVSLTVYEIFRYITRDAIVVITHSQETVDVALIHITDRIHQHRKLLLLQTSWPISVRREAELRATVVYTEAQQHIAHRVQKLAIVSILQVV